MLAFNIYEMTLPLENPVLKFLIILLIILIAPILLNKLKIPHLLGLIIAGAIIGPHGFFLIERDSGIILSGTAGLLYIMFLAGLEIDLAEFKKNSGKSLIFGMYTFSIPMILGIVVGLWVLKYSIPTSVLLASMFASHTLIAYPIISKLGIAKNKAVNITVGGTMITDTLALLVLAVIVGMTTGEVNTAFWARLTVSLIIFASIVMLVFPLVGRWFFKKYEDSVLQYIFVLVMVFMGSVLAEIAGVEAIIGAFLSGLALNRLIPHTSALMNRVEFVGNAIFIPFFLIGVGMLIDYRAFFTDIETIKVGTVMVVIATVSKFLAAWLAQKTFGFNVDQRRLIFGLSNAQAAATLAAVLVGYNIILGENPDGTPIRLLSESVLNGTIVMILVTCTIATFQAQKGAKNLALKEASEEDNDDQEIQEKILIPVSNPETIDEMINLAITIKSKKNKSPLHVLSIIDSNNMDGTAEKNAKKVLNMASISGAATDIMVNELLRYDVNIVNGISNVVKEHRISDLILGLHKQKNISDAFLGSLTEGILAKSNTTTLIYKPYQPFGTIRRHLIIVPENAENEIGFPFWLLKVWNIARNSSAKLVFYGTENVLNIIKEIQTSHPIQSEFIHFSDWDDFLILSRDIQPNDNLIILMSRKDKPSFHNHMLKIPYYLSKYFPKNSFIMIYPMQQGVAESNMMDLTNPTFLEPLVKLDEIGKTIIKLFKGK